MSSSVRIQTEAYLKTIDVKADRVLDIGGCVLKIKGRTKSWDVKEYKILDMEEPHEANAPVDLVWDMSEFITDFDYYNCEDPEITKAEKAFDIAFAIEVYEHCWNPVQALQNTNYFLKSGGILYATFPTLYPTHNPPNEDYVRYTKAGVEKILKETGFICVEITPRKAVSNGWLVFCAAEKMRPSKICDPSIHQDTGYMVKCIKA